METVWFIGLALAAFLLGACPFSVWIADLALHRNIRTVGDGNPGPTNVFKAGGKFWGVVVLMADILKGVPFVLAARLLGLITPIPYIVAICAILGHAYSPFLGLRGGKALSVAAGTLIGLAHWEIILMLAILYFIGFLLFYNDSWTVMIGTVTTLVILILLRVDMWEILFMCCVTLIFFIKQAHDLTMGPHYPGRLVSWLRSRKGV